MEYAIDLAQVTIQRHSKQTFCIQTTGTIFVFVFMQRIRVHLRRCSTKAISYTEYTTADYGNRSEPKISIMKNKYIDENNIFLKIHKKYSGAVTRETSLYRRQQNNI